MFRKILYALVALATISAAAVPSAAQARGWRGGRGRGWGWGPAVGLGLGLGIAAGYPYYGGYYGYGPYGCWRPVRYWTPYGPVWRRVWVC